MKLKRRPEWQLWKHQRIHLMSGPLYLERWVLDFFLFSIRLHCFHRSDDDRALHDHPFGFVTFVLKNGYYDVTGDGRHKEFMPPGTFKFRPYTHTHTVELLGDVEGEERPAWTLVFTGPVRHRWGFWVRNKLGEKRFVNSQRYFREFGHH